MTYQVPTNDDRFDEAPEQPEVDECSKYGCTNAAECECDHCDRAFCGDHGTKGGDVQVQDVGAVARPSACWKCGGYNADDDYDAETEGRYAAGDAAYTAMAEES